MTLRLVSNDETPDEETHGPGTALIVEYDSTLYARLICVPVPGSGVVTVIAVDKEGVETFVASALVADGEAL